MVPASRLYFSLVKIGDETCRAVPDGHELTATASVARVSGDRLLFFVPVATETEFYAGWEPEDYQRANARLHRTLRHRLREFRLHAERDAD
ncbi:MULTISPECIES: hypothetical protein [Bacteria]|uniref:Uncharacterized protein n=1 Tax=Methylorubrum thiocyanatum TaxID=47958 RepID=A0AA40VCK8_9HYPH|nr:hypothetical protein [Methylorubrum thiocyanatum]AWI88454.1 hypothetical protein C0214_09460 [Methylobacterium sp. DM1]MBA8915057.1 hypothetical protein [Methylorubrum thiocyanatum]GJE79463.1 hypothetical protein CJNNKLLH_0789 [Methylorubrum thiocyanatum]